LKHGAACRLVLPQGQQIHYEFISNQSTAYGNNLALADNSPLRYSIYSGDVNGDAIVDAFDLSEIDDDAFNFASGILVDGYHG
jgi:hypothetical protein